MVRLVIMLVFAACLALAGVFYSTSSREKPSDKLKISDTRRIVMTNLSQWRFHGKEISSRLTAGLGEFHDPNLVVLSNAVFLERGVGPKKVSVVTDRAEINLSAKRLSDVFRNARILSITSPGPFIAHLKDDALSGTAAVFQPEEQLLSSSSPFRITGPGRWLSGQQGFRYDLSREWISIIGPMEGVLRRHATARQKLR